MQIEIQVPEVWKGVLTEASRITSQRKDLVVEHPALNVRSTPIALSLAILSFLQDKKVAIFSIGGKPEISSLIRRNYSSTGLTRPMVTKFSEWYKGQFGGELWVIDPLISKLPFSKVDHAYFIDAHSLKAPLKVKATRKFFFTELCNRGSWQYNLGRNLGQFSNRETVLETLSLEKTLKAFPDLEEDVLEVTDPLYERLMEVKDAKPKQAGSNFMTFARKRLHIVTQKPIELLSEEQKRIAAIQFGQPLVPFVTNSIQKRYLAIKRLNEAKGRRPWYILVKYRRGGFTTIEQAQSYQLVNESPRSAVVTLTDSMPKSKRIFRMVSTMHEHDPRALTLDGDSKSELSFSNGSTFFIGTAGSKAFARGDTLARCHGSEVAFWAQGPNQTEIAEEVLAGLMGAAEFGEITLESTPNGRNFFHSRYQEAKNNQSEFTAIFLRWFDDAMNREVPGTFDLDEIHSTLSEDEKDLIAEHSIDYAQIAYRRKKQREYKTLFPQEFPEDDESCFIVSGLCFFDVTRILEVSNRVKKYNGKDKPIFREVIKGGIAIVWEEALEGEEYCLGADTSEGLGPPCDMNGFGIVKRRTGEQVASLHGRWKPEELAELICEWSDKYNRALMAVERNNHGHSVLNTIKQLGYDQPHYLGGRLYYYRENRPGWFTNSETRPRILDEVACALQDAPDYIRDEQFISELGSFRLQPSGKWEADSGSHDDTIFKWGIAYLMRSVPIAKPSMDFV